IIRCPPSMSLFPYTTLFRSLSSGRLSLLKSTNDTTNLPDSLSAVLDTTRNALQIGAYNSPDTTNNINDSTDRYFMAWHNVRIFSDSLQAVSDSLFYSGMDSIFRLFTDPIVWASGSQVTGDTIYLYTKNKQADRLYVFENGLVINQSDQNMFNQV